MATGDISRREGFTKGQLLHTRLLQSGLAIFNSSPFANASCCFRESREDADDLTLQASEGHIVRSHPNLYLGDKFRAGETGVSCTEYLLKLRPAEMAKDSIERGKGERPTAFRPARRQPAAPPEPSQSPPLLFPTTSAGNSFPTCRQEAWPATPGKERQSHFRPSELWRRAPSTDSRARCSRFPPSPYRERHGSPRASGREKFAAPGRPARVSEGKQAARPSDQPLPSLLLAR